MSAQPHGLSGQQIAKSNLLKFQKWIIQRDLANDWISYLRGEKLNRSEIASESFFLIRTPPEPSHQGRPESLEKRLREWDYRRIGQTVSHLKLVSAGLTVDRRVMAEKSISDKRIKELEGQNASLRAEIHDLRDQISRFKQLDDHLSKTGRLLHR
jgi:hypothetical protein